MVCLSAAKRPPGIAKLASLNTRVEAIKTPSGAGWKRKVGLMPWFARNGWGLWKLIGDVDVVHTPVPGDVGVIALCIALIQRKKIFVRHCGTWGVRSSLGSRFLAWFLPRIAAGRVVVMATGGGSQPPESKTPSIQWIFSTTLSGAEFENIVPASPWRPGEGLRLVTVGRLTTAKNTIACIEAMQEIRVANPYCKLSVVGDGPCRPQLEEFVKRHDLTDSVNFTGNIGHDAVIEVLCRSHLFLFPTCAPEGFPKAVVEAMACGLPVLAAPVSVLPDLLSSGCGVLLDGTSAADVARAVVEMSRNPEGMDKMSKSGRVTAGALTLERWRDLIGSRLEAAWGQTLKDGVGRLDSDQ